MTDTFQILDAIRTLAGQSVPELQGIYLEQLPQTPERPCLLARSVSSDLEDAAKALVRIRERIELVVLCCDHCQGGGICPRHTEPDGVPENCGICLLELQSRVLGLFRHGYLRAGDRALPVRASKGDSALRESRTDEERGRQSGRAVVDVELDFLDLRCPEQTDPMMETVETTIISKG